ncbi:MAG: hypothetical protein VX884_01750 [Pseudomonadota bacterium]|nr:hypothetical protein [Pseudomonadota bacterium]
MLRTLFLVVPFLLLVHVTSSLALPPCPTDSTAYWDNCEGILTSDTGQKYVGEFRDNKRNGHGIWTHPDGDKYVGEFRDGKRHGHGTYTWADGAKYIGEHRDGQANGHGTYTWADGRRYVGDFRDGKSHGQGTQFWSDGEVWVGQFRNDEWVSGNKYTAGNVPPEVYGENTAPTPPSYSTPMDKAQAKCEELGFLPKTEKYGDCVLKLLEMN